MTFGRNIHSTLEYSLYASVFMYVCFCLLLSSLKLHMENNACIFLFEGNVRNFCHCQWFSSGWTL